MKSILSENKNLTDQKSGVMNNKNIERGLRASKEKSIISNDKTPVLKRTFSHNPPAFGENSNKQLSQGSKKPSIHAIA